MVVFDRVADMEDSGFGHVEYLIIEVGIWRERGFGKLDWLIIGELK